jgi:hypothetical protein
MCPLEFMKRLAAQENHLHHATSSALLWPLTDSFKAPRQATSRTALGRSVTLAVAFPAHGFGD